MADGLRTALSKKGTDKGTDGRIYPRAVAEKVVDTPLRGSTGAIKPIFERMDGKVPQTDVLEGNQDAPIPIRYIKASEPSGDTGESPSPGGGDG